MRWEGVILGEAVSKANSRRLVLFGKRPASIKSVKALDFVASARQQLRPTEPLLKGPVRFTAIIYYATERPDLDESLVLDVLQGIVYANDRQVRQKRVDHGIDKTNPRVEIVVETLDSLVLVPQTDFALPLVAP